MGRNLIIEFRPGIYYDFAICSGDIQGFYYTGNGTLEFVVARAGLLLGRTTNRRLENDWDIFSGPTK